MVLPGRGAYRTIMMLTSIDRQKLTLLMCIEGQAQVVVPVFPIVQYSYSNNTCFHIAKMDGHTTVLCNYNTVIFFSQIHTVQ